MPMSTQYKSCFDHELLFLKIFKHHYRKKTSKYSDFKHVDTSFLLDENLSWKHQTFGGHFETLILVWATFLINQQLVFVWCMCDSLNLLRYSSITFFWMSLVAKLCRPNFCSLLIVEIISPLSFADIFCVKTSSLLLTIGLSFFQYRWMLLAEDMGLCCGTGL